MDLEEKPSKPKIEEENKLNLEEKPAQLKMEQPKLNLEEKPSAQATSSCPAIYKSSK